MSYCFGRKVQEIVGIARLGTPSLLVTYTNHYLIPTSMIIARVSPNIAL